MKKTYFASDFHLGIDTKLTSLEREKLIVRWLNDVSEDAEAIYLLGDVFDYWFEYQQVIPKGFTRLLGKIAELTDRGIKVIWITGNHDMWTFGYLQKELNVSIHKIPIKRIIYGKTIYLAHGDGLGEGDFRYKVIKSILRNPFCQFLFSLIPSRLGLWLMQISSNTSRQGQSLNETIELEKDAVLMDYSAQLLKFEKIDYFLYGHRHRPNIINIPDSHAKYINLGDWTHHFSYGQIDGNGNFELKRYLE